MGQGLSYDGGLMLKPYKLRTQICLQCEFGRGRSAVGASYVASGAEFALGREGSLWLALCDMLLQAATQLGENPIPMLPYRHTWSLTGMSISVKTPSKWPEQETYKRAYNTESAIDQG